MQTLTLYKDGHPLICHETKKEKFISLGWSENEQTEKTENDGSERTKRILESPDIHQAVFNEMNREELSEYARKTGIPVKKKTTREELIQTLLQEKEKQHNDVQS